MYVKIRTDGAVGIGRGGEGEGDIALGYGEAHMIAAALEKLAQTARNYKQTYKKTTDVGSGNKIEFERSDDGTITISGDGQTIICSEEEIRELARLLKELPPIEVAPPSDYVETIPPSGGFCLAVLGDGGSVRLTLPDAALLKISVLNSMNSKYYEEPIVIGERELSVVRTSDLKWELKADGESVRFTAYEVESVVAGLHNGILDVLMNLVKSMGSDEIADIRVKSHIQHLEQEVTLILQEHKKAKNIVKDIMKYGKKVLASGEDADVRATEFIGLCQYVYSCLDPVYFEPLFALFSSIFVVES